jgi:hypothetical protein
MIRKIAWLLFVAVLLLSACQPKQGSAKDLLPDVPNTTVVEGQTMTQFLAKLADGAALAAANPELIPVIQRIETSASCYQNVGAVALRTYTDKTFPLNAGIVAIADRNAVTDPANFLNCVVKPRSPQAAQAAQTALEPCAKTYTLKKDTNEFYIAYIASTPQLCEAFCSKLEGCTGP